MSYSVKPRRLAQKVITVSQMRAQKVADNALAQIKIDADNAERKRIADVLYANPSIVELCRNGERVFYVYPVGGGYREGRDPINLI